MVFFVGDLGVFLYICTKFIVTYIVSMILSMTGYGKASAVYGDKKITAEVKSLNSKSLDLSTRVAQCYREKEMEIRSTTGALLQRGKVELALWVERDETAEAATVNSALAASYYKQICEISKDLDIPAPLDPWAVIMRMPDMMGRQDRQETLTDEEWTVAAKVVREALDQLIAFRIQEGEALAKKFVEKLDSIGSLLRSIEPLEKARTERIRQRLTDALTAIPEVEYDRGRLEQEMIFYIEKLDINEEKQRLANHLEYFRTTMDGEPGQGKKLGFIAQEMGREINTTGSKSNQAEMQNIVVRMKDELEQIKEQVLNVL